MMKKRSTTVVVVILTLIMTFMEMSALPAALFCNVKIKDINPIYITLMLNFYWLLQFIGCVKRFLSKIGGWVYSLKEYYQG